MTPEQVARQRIDALTESDFKEFLSLRNNRHWVGLHRMGNRVCRDMDALRQALKTLLDESRSIRERLNELAPLNKPNPVPGLGRAVLTPILFVTHPDRYSVLNKTTRAAMQALEIWPDFERGLPFGERYERVNAIQFELAREPECDIWTLDYLWWRTGKPIHAKNPWPTRSPPCPRRRSAWSGIYRSS
jgi:hypothetical protein